MSYRYRRSAAISSAHRSKAETWFWIWIFSHGLVLSGLFALPALSFYPSLVFEVVWLTLLVPAGAVFGTIGLIMALYHTIQK